MPNLTTQDLIDYFNRSKGETPPFEINKAVAAVRDSANAGEIDLLEELADVMVTTYRRLNPGECPEDLERSALYVFTTLCFLADHEFTHPDIGKRTAAMKEAIHPDLLHLSMTSRRYIHEQGPARTYACRSYYGNAMIDAQTIIQGKKGLNLQQDIFQEGGKSVPPQFLPPSTLVRLI